MLPAMLSIVIGLASLVTIAFAAPASLPAPLDAPTPGSSPAVDGVVQIPVVFDTAINVRALTDIVIDTIFEHPQFQQLLSLIRNPLERSLVIVLDDLL